MFLTESIDVQWIPDNETVVASSKPCGHQSCTNALTASCANYNATMLAQYPSCQYCAPRKCVRKIQMTSPQCKTECHAWNTHVRQTGSSTSTPCVGYETRINVSSGRGTCSLIKSTNNDSECPPVSVAPANSYLVQGNYVATYNHMICAYASRHNVPVTDGYRCYVICVGGNCPTISECP